MDLTTLTQGQQGIITGFNGMAASYQRQLYDMGIYIGSEVTVLKILGYGKLLYLQIDGIYFCIRKSDAKKITIEKVG